MLSGSPFLSSSSDHLLSGPSESQAMWGRFANQALRSQRRFTRETRKPLTLKLLLHIYHALCIIYVRDAIRRRRRSVWGSQSLIRNFGAFHSPLLLPPKFHVPEPASHALVRCDVDVSLSVHFLSTGRESGHQRTKCIHSFRY
jgi:hypothetical protein